MPDSHCAIRFTDPDHTVEAHVLRDKFGRPEEMLSNLAQLKRTALPDETNPGSIAAQFVVLDSLVLAYQERSLRNVIAAVEQVCQDKEDSLVGHLLGHHSVESVPDPDVPIRCYGVEIADEDDAWLVRRGGPIESGDDAASEVIDDVNWIYEGTLTDVLRKLL